MADICIVVEFHKGESATNGATQFSLYFGRNFYISSGTILQITVIWLLKGNELSKPIFIITDFIHFLNIDKKKKKNYVLDIFSKPLLGRVQ